MPLQATRYLYLARHGEAAPDESGLSHSGRQQAILLGRRRRARPITALYHGPLPRALQTARLVGEQLDGVSLTRSPAAGDADRHELVVTHNFLVAWLVRLALDAPAWRWLGLNVGHTALTVIRYAPGLPPSLLTFNDMSHLPPELRWTGFPPNWQV